MFGPGLLLQFVAVSSASTLTGKGNSVMLMWGRDDDEANEGASGWGELSRQAPVSMNAPRSAAACSPRARARKVCRCMVRFSFCTEMVARLRELPVAPSVARPAEGWARHVPGGALYPAWSTAQTLVWRGGHNRAVA